MKRIITALLLTIALFTACKKDKDTFTTSAINGKWLYVSAHNKMVENGNVLTDKTLTFDAGSHFTFNTDGSFNALVDGDADSGTWNLTGKTLNLDIKTSGGGIINMAAEVKALTDNSLIIYTKDVDGTFTNETTTTFKK